MPPLNGLIAYWPLNGDAKDLADNPSDGGINGQVSFDSGICQQSAVFNGGGSVQIGAPAKLTGLSQLSLSAWVFAESTNNQGVVTKNNGGLCDFGFELSHGGMFCFALNENYSPQGVLLGKPVVINSWRHYVGTWDGVTVCLYENGKLVSSDSYSGKPTIDGNLELDIGKLGSYNGWPYFSGRIDEVCIFNRALNASEVRMLYEQRFDPGSLCVTIVPQAAIDAGAQWRRAGTSSWLNSGDTETNVPAGSCSIEFNQIADWDSPTNLNVTNYQRPNDIPGGRIHPTLSFIRRIKRAGRVYLAEVQGALVGPFAERYRNRQPLGVPLPKPGGRPSKWQSVQFRRA
jgi:hypothetical protein